MKPRVDYYSDFVCGVIKQLLPQNILEIGVGCDCYTIRQITKMLSEIKEKDRPNYYGIDIFEPGNKEEVGKNYIKMGADFTIIIGSSFEERTYEPVPECDLILIDASHSTQAVVLDTRMALSKLAKNGILIYHDYNSDHIKKGLNILKEENGLEILGFDCINIAMGRPK
jgi:predicted O-methyltransferase YrrM